jgi:hypothetical protein
MSALGQKRASRGLFDHLVGTADKGQRDCHAERLNRFQVDDQFDFRGPNDRQVGRLLAFKNPAGVDADLTMNVRKTASIA